MTYTSHSQALSRMLHIEHLIHQSDTPDCCKIHMLIEWLEINDVVWQLPFIINTK